MHSLTVQSNIDLTDEDEWYTQKIENFEYPFFCRFNLSQILQYCMDVGYIKEFENNP